jgi:hypothetical protein
MQIAWKRIKSNKGSAGIEEMSIGAFPYKFPTTTRKVCVNRYATVLTHPLPVKRFEIPKTMGGMLRSGSFCKPPGAPSGSALGQTRLPGGGGVGERKPRRTDSAH